MKNNRIFLLAAVNAKFIHSNPAVYSLAAYARTKRPELGDCIALAEYTINQPESSILADLYLRKPAAVGFSCYIWNIEIVFRIAKELKKLLPETEIWLGGPEVTYDAAETLKSHPELRGIMIGEGEVTFTELLGYYQRKWEEPDYDLDQDILSRIKGIAFSGKGVCMNPPRDLTTLSELPFLYEDTAKFENRIIYYESSRGCPFRCSYCLSSIDKQVRFRDMGIVKRELQHFLDAKVKQVKFVDRTFNCSHEHGIGIWTYIRDHYNGVTNFHFEIAADLLNEEELSLLSTFPPGAVQMEIGVQSTNPATIREIDRVMDLSRLRQTVKKLQSCRNIHIHLDLIAGLPYEDMKSFQNSFNEVFAMHPEQLQLGFLKVLKGSKMHERAKEYGIVYRDTPPYEVLYTKWISYEELLELKGVEEMVELYYNSSQFSFTLPFLLEEFETAYDFFSSLADYYRRENLFVQTPSRIYRYQVLLSFGEEICPEKKELLRQMLTLDYYARENAKNRPGFAGQSKEDKTFALTFWQQESRLHRYLKDDAYQRISSKVLAHMCHLEWISYHPLTGEVLSPPACVLFDYQDRNPLTFQAGMIPLPNPLIWEDELSK